MRTFLVASSLTILASCNAIFGIEPGELGGGAAQGASGPGGSDTGGGDTGGSGGTGGDGGNVGGSGGSGASGGDGGSGAGGSAPVCDPSEDPAEGIDASCGVFLDTNLTDNGNGDRSAPFNDLTDALEAVSEGGRLYICGSTIDVPSTAMVYGGTSIYGNLRCGTWLHDATATVTLRGSARPVMLIEGPPNQPVHLQEFTVLGLAQTSAGSTVVGVAAVNATVTLRGMHVESDAAMDGADGLTHSPDDNGGPGSAGANATCSQSQIGTGGVSSCGAPSGGNGGGNCTTTSASGQMGGNPGGGNGGAFTAAAGCFPGQSGTGGAHGTSATMGANGIGTFDEDGWQPAMASTPTNGNHGGGGGGGGGCTAGTSPAGGGGGGSGGCGGDAGGNGQSGGSSFALVALGMSNITLEGTMLRSGTGGGGGDGGRGEFGGGGGGGGAPNNTSSRVGGSGGTGGTGGNGAAGPGGHSALIVTTPNVSISVDSATIGLLIGPGGGGMRGVAGMPWSGLGQPPAGAEASNGLSCGALNFGAPATDLCQSVAQLMP